MEKEGANEQLVVHWMDGQPAPQAILDLLACNCAKNCELQKCECMVNGLNVLICADCHTARTKWMVKKALTSMMIMMSWNLKMIMNIRHVQFNTELTIF